MANFKVGDRVRFARPECFFELRGCTGVIVAVDADDPSVYCVLFDTPTSRAERDGTVHLLGFKLEPLTPPAEDTWAADKVKQVTKPQHVEPVRVPDKFTA